MRYGVEILCRIYAVYPQPFLIGSLEACIVSLSFGSEGIYLLKGHALTVYRQSVIVGQSHIFCTAAVLFAIVPILMVTRAASAF